MKHGTTRRKKRIMAVGIPAAILIVGAGVCFFAFHHKSIEIVALAEPMRTQVTAGSISTTVTGTGTLKNDTANEVKIPADLTVEEVLVESGDTVKEGDALATVNQTSILKKLSAVQEELKSLDEEINEKKDEKESAHIKTYVAGRVKKIYAEEGDRVASVMKEQGAVLVLSIDGLMAVTLKEVSGVSSGDAVTVTLADGDTKEGTIESVSEKTCIVTLTDDGPSVDEEVKVSDQEGNVIGSGVLYIHQPIGITGTVGTVSAVSVEENEKVSASSTLIELEDVPVSTEYQELLSKRSDLAETLQVLTQLSQDHTIRAEYDGTVESVEVTAEKSGSGAGEASEGVHVASASKEADQAAVFVLTSAGNETESAEEAKVTSITDMEEVFRRLSESVETPVFGEVPASSISETEQYTGKIRWTPAHGTFAEKTGYTAVIELTARAGYQFVIPEGTQLSYPNAQMTQWEIGEQCEQNTLRLTILFPETAEKETESTPESETQGGQQNSENQLNPDEPQSQSGQQGQDEPNEKTQQGKNGQNSGNQQDDTQGTNQKQQQNQSGQAAGVSGVSMAGLSGSSSQTEAAGDSSDTSEESGNTSMATAFTISKNENMCLSVNIDELDILSIEEGQKVTVTIDALEGQEFEGELTKINHTASNNGGVTKYTAEVTFPKKESMLAGMNATATIVVEEKENILTLPAEAVQERGNHSFVYTQKGEDGVLSGEVEIETGLSDGNKVEIVSGLEAEQEIYYNRVINTDGNDNGLEGMQMNGMPDMGGMPAMGNGQRPDGGGFGEKQGSGQGGPMGQRGE